VTAWFFNVLTVSQRENSAGRTKENLSAAAYTHAFRTAPLRFGLVGVGTEHKYYDAHAYGPRAGA
jgi:hypothetical protein